MPEEEEVAILRMHLDDLIAELWRVRGQKPTLNYQLDENAKHPQRIHPGDAGFDLFTSKDTTIEPGEFVDVHTGVYIETPPNMWAMITGRSSTLRKRGLLVNQGIIDQGYRGELYAGVWNLTDKTVHVNVGERLAQFIPMPLTAGEVALRNVQTLGYGSRGTDGFGSTGI